MMQADTWLSLVKGASPWKGAAEVGALFGPTISPVSGGGMCPRAGSGLHLGIIPGFGGEFEMVGGRECVPPASCLSA